VWGIQANGISQAFVRMMKRARAGYEAECAVAGTQPNPRMLRDLRFHDLRRGHVPVVRAGPTRCRWPPLRVTTLQMLKRYTHLRAEDLVDLLG
jgi:hypothetical protein